MPAAHELIPPDNDSAAPHARERPEQQQPLILSLLRTGRTAAPQLTGLAAASGATDAGRQGVTDEQVDHGGKPVVQYGPQPVGAHGEQVV